MNERFSIDTVLEKVRALRAPEAPAQPSIPQWSAEQRGRSAAEVPLLPLPPEDRLDPSRTTYTVGDFLALSDEAMINEAKKEFKSKCYTVDQIRNLGNLFLNEAGKFQFYEAAYPNSSDKTGFVALERELKDPYFIHRFKNLVK